MPAPHSADSRGGWARNRRRHSAALAVASTPCGSPCLPSRVAIQFATGGRLWPPGPLSARPAREDPGSCACGLTQPGGSRAASGEAIPGADASASRDKRPGVLQLEPLDGPYPYSERGASTSPEAAGVGRQTTEPPRAVRTGWLDILLMSAGRKCRKYGVSRRRSSDRGPRSQ